VAVYTMLDDGTHDWLDVTTPSAAPSNALKTDAATMAHFDSGIKAVDNAVDALGNAVAGRLLPAAGTTGQIPIKQADGSWASGDMNTGTGAYYATLAAALTAAAGGAFAVGQVITVGT
jgi:predicted HTH transcriptional regulator